MRRLEDLLRLADDPTGSGLSNREIATCDVLVIEKRRHTMSLESGFSLQFQQNRLLNNAPRQCFERADAIILDGDAGIRSHQVSYNDDLLHPASRKGKSSRIEALRPQESKHSLPFGRHGTNMERSTLRVMRMSADCNRKE